MSDLLKHEQDNIHCWLRGGHDKMLRGFVSSPEIPEWIRRSAATDPSEWFETHSAGEAFHSAVVKATKGLLGRRLPLQLKLNAFRVIEFIESGLGSPEQREAITSNPLDFLDRDLDQLERELREGEKLS